MSDEIPPWERPNVVQARIQSDYEEQERQRLAANAAIMDRTLDMAEHLPDYELDGDCCSGTTLYIDGCSCGVTSVRDEESWKDHVTEVQRRDRRRVWQEGREALAMATLPGAVRLTNPYEEA